MHLQSMSKHSCKGSYLILLFTAGVFRTKYDYIVGDFYRGLFVRIPKAMICFTGNISAMVQ